MAKYTYLLFSAAVFLPVLFLSLKYDVKPQKNYRALAAVAGLVSLPFIIWDMWAASNGHWLFNPEFVLPYRIGGIPLEEILFFLTVPYAMIYVWEVLKKHIGDVKVRGWWPQVVTAAIGLFALVLTVAYWDAGYSRSVGLAVLLTTALLITSPLVRLRRYWIFQGAHLLLFFACNTFLTSLPVISYGQDSIIGLRIGTIPLEDFLFSYALISLAILAWRKYQVDLD